MVSSRTIDIALRNNEVVTLDSADLDVDPATILELLREGECAVRAWLTIANEYLLLRKLDAAQTVAEAANAYFNQPSLVFPDATAIPRIHCIIANITLERARSSPKVVLPNAQSDVLSGLLNKSQLYKRAAEDVNHSQQSTHTISSPDDRTQLAVFLTRANFLLSARDMDEALNAFQQVLTLRPTNIPAIIGKARIYYIRKEYRESLRLFQRAITLNPNCKPDPRIGVGLCLWALGNRDKASLAWQRSVELDADAWSSQLLIGLEAINASRDFSRADQERAGLYKIGLSRLERVFRLNNTSAASANVLSDFFLQKGNTTRALKLAERAIQFADTLSVLTDGYIRAARVAHASERWEDAKTLYTSALEASPRHMLANLGLAQVLVRNDELPAALHHLEKVVEHSENDLACVETLILQASVRALPRLAISAAETAADKNKARDMFDRVLKVLDGNASHHALVIKSSTASGRSIRSVQALRNDAEMQIEVASLWQIDNLERTAKALQEAIRIRSLSDATGISLAKLRSNLAAVKHIDGNVVEARVLYEEALVGAFAEGGPDADPNSTTMLYNLARAYEDTSEITLAREAYSKLLARHPEYTDAKVRLAAIQMDERRFDDAHSLLKQALASGDKTSEIRAFYIWFLAETGQTKPAKSFTFNVMKDDKHDLFALCAAARLLFNDARENRDPSSAATEARKKNFHDAANIYAKALGLDPSCSVAAQGIAIMIAEDSLGTWAPGLALDDGGLKNRAIRCAREAIELFAKVRESYHDGSVYVNMGHCYFTCEEFDKAIENYDTASSRFYRSQSVPVLLYLARAWFAKANKTGGFGAMQQALKHTEMALHFQPNDKAIIYNIAMIEQKAAELLFSLTPDHRKLGELQTAISHASHAQKLFASLAADTSRPLPYSQDIAQNRFKYGESMLRRSTEHLLVQQAYEAEFQARMDVARTRRQEEKERMEEHQRRALLATQERAQQLALRRQREREEAKEWALQRKAESDEEEEKRNEKAARKAAAKRAKAEIDSGEENQQEGGKKERKKKRTTKPPGTGFRKRREQVASIDQDDEGVIPDGIQDDGDEADAVFSGNDDDTGDDGHAQRRLQKTRLKKRAVDEDEGDGPSSSAPSAKRKKIKSKEIIDSDDDI